MNPRQMVKLKSDKQTNRNKSQGTYIYPGTYTHTHTHTHPKQTKESKVQESESVSKGSQKWYQPIKSKTNRKKKTKAECQVRNKARKTKQT